MTVTALLAMGFLVASSFAAAQDAPAGTSGGQITIGALGVNNVASSKFTEYREVPKGMSIPYANLFSKTSSLDFYLDAHNVRQTDQRYTGWFNTSAVGLSFDYNQTPHNMGNDGRTILSELSEGVWGMSQALRLYHQNTIAATPTAGRTVLFYDSLLGPTFAAANSVDISGVRKRGTAELDLGAKLPIDLTFTYMRELKTGYRGAGGGGVYSTVSSVIDVPEPLNEITQDIGVRAAYNFKAGNVYAGFVRNIYNNRAETLTIDNPFQAFDAPFVSSVGGASRARWINAPDNEASTGNAGFLLKFAKQTRLGGRVALATWTQNAAFHPFTINSALLTSTGARADSLSTLQQPSFDGKINTTTMNVTFTSRPITGLGLRAHFRSYDLTNKTNRFIITGDAGGTPDRTWSVVTPSAGAPYGHATANVYDSKTTRFNASASYDIGALTLEGQVRSAKLERTSREADTGKDNGFAFTALFHANEWLGVRGTYDQAKRTAEGHTVYGFQADEAERETTRTGVDIEVTPMAGVELSFAYFRRDVQYTNRPNRVQVTGGVPVAGAQPIPGTPSGLLEATYDSYTGEINFLPNARVELGAYYTYEKDATTNQWSTTTGANLNNLLNYAGTDETNTFGVNAAVQLVPEKWTFSFNAMRQKVDGLMDVTANPTGAFFTARATVGGPQDIADWDDTKLTTVAAQLDYAVAKAWTLSAGYMYENYDFSDAFSSGDLLMPQSILIFMKANNSGYDANVLYAKLNYRF
ncbi:MAG: MtrB/PioB family outer membrane beta-barrel protein [Vicinamibacterales bacterium]|nr:MtrB/PioB family outer membrane beta-barrel protein [Vicinamibacterales bacterium]